MNVTKLENGSKSNISTHQITTEDLQNEYNYILAERVLENMLVAGVITVDECNKIKALNRQYFSPVLSEIMP